MNGLANICYQTNFSLLLFAEKVTKSPARLNVVRAGAGKPRLTGRAGNTPRFPDGSLM